MDLGRLGVHEMRLEDLARAHEQGVGERPVTPEDAAAVQLDEQPRERVQEAIALERARRG
jgi:hypothetical protein